MECDWCGGYISQDSTAKTYQIHGKDKKNTYYSVFCCGKCKNDWVANGSPDIKIHTAKNGACFITTATIQSRNLPDDCHELMALREFRDSFMKKDESMKQEVEEYYVIAPKICDRIDAEKNSAEIYDGIYQKWIKKAVDCCDKGDKKRAMKFTSQWFLN